MKTSALVLLAAFSAIVCAEAQIIPPSEPSNGKSEPTKPAVNEGDEAKVKGFWQAKLAGGEYVVSIERITSVSRHSYVLDGTLLVDEMTIDTTGQALARFYFLSPLGAGATSGGGSAVAESGKGFLDTPVQKAGVEPENMVIKKYPDTTHAKAIEYRITSQTELSNLYNSAKKAWQSGQGGQYTAPVK